jgi:hypothetical protein
MVGFRRQAVDEVNALPNAIAFSRLHWSFERPRSLRHCRGLDAGNSALKNFRSNVKDLPASDVYKQAAGCRIRVCPRDPAGDELQIIALSRVLALLKDPSRSLFLK